MQLVLVHGWGFHGGIWQELLPRLDGHDLHIVDLGFCRGGPKATTRLPEHSVAIGHSFGLMWLLRHGPRPLKGLVSVCGFDCFHRHVAPEEVDPIRQGIGRNIDAQMRAFWRQCGAPEFSSDEFDRATLLAGLDWLCRWDARADLESLGAPVLALASEDDPIFPAAASRAVWEGQSQFHMSSDGGHALPLTRPDWCAARISEFVDGLRA
ncbi:MAG: alpha/beta fold hydrolase [Pseudomonadota bacterium]|nr:alpha/beta fold hydrolase [Pseudomonadota bacterium]